jgi:two-component system, chemotaxis family, sensor kinase CheA
VSDGLDEIQGIFFEECAEGLASAEAGLAAMAAGDVTADTIASVFRAVHSIKGGSGAFGHEALLKFSHLFENVLDDVRAGRIAPTPPVLKALLISLDMLSDHVAAAKQQTAPPEDGATMAMLEAVQRGEVATGTQVSPVPATAIDADPFGFAPVPVDIGALETAAVPDPFGFEPVAGSLDELGLAPAAPVASWQIRFVPSRASMANGGEPLLVIRELERLGGRIVRVDTSRLPELREIDPEAAYFAWELEVPGTVERSDIDDCFDFVAPDSVISITAPASAGGAPEPAAAPEAADAAVLPAMAAPEDDGADVPPQAPAALPPATPSAAVAVEARANDNVTQTIRVDLNRLDNLLNLVCELVIRNSILADRLTPADQERVQLSDLTRLTREIQDNVMSLRAQPIRQVFSRVPRLLRELSMATGKQVRLETVGEQTEVDKGVIERLGDPLTHMIRNAVDHGLETPAERLAAGKTPDGTVRISAEQKGGRILVRVSDDGRGINRAKVRQKAIERGIIGPDAVLSDEDCDSLIMAPGFSTSDIVSNISGRGVGMDVVRSNVEAMGGRVEIQSTPGKGAAFTMALPLTLAILDGMIVRLGDQRFVLPLSNVVEAVEPAPGQVRRMTPDSEVIDLRGRYLPVRRLSGLFEQDQNRQTPPRAPVIIMDTDVAGHVGLMVDAIDDRREVVIKSLDANFYPIRGVAGATILGDGSIALILDIDALVASGAAGHGIRFHGKGLAA